MYNQSYRKSIFLRIYLYHNVYQKIEKKSIRHRHNLLRLLTMSTTTSPLRKRTKIIRKKTRNKGTQTEQMSCKRVFQANNSFLFASVRCNYPMALLGRSNPQKELMETSYAHFHVKSCIKQLFKGNPHVAFKMYHEFLNSDKVLCIVPGDGINPRTAGIFAGTTNWQVLSIDPDMGGRQLSNDPKPIDVSKIINEKYKINWANLTCIRGLLEDVDFSKYHYEMVVFVNVHSHSNFKEMYNNFDCNKLGYTMPCCKHIVSKLDGKQHLSEIIRQGEITDISYTVPKKYYVYKSIEDLSFL